MIPPPSDSRTVRTGALVRPFVLALAVVAAASMLVQWVRTESLDVFEGCGWDGRHYCGMADGGMVPGSPFSRRVLVPWIVRALPVEDPVHGFRIVNALALLGGVAALVWLCHRLGLSDRPYVAALVSLFVLNPWTVRLYLSYPVHTDNVSLTLLLLWCALTLTHARWAVLLSVVALVLLVLTREQWGLVAIPAVWIAVLLGHRRPGWAIASTFAAAGALWYGLSRPHSPAGEGVGELLQTWWEDVTASPTHAVRFAFLIMFGLGLVVVLLVFDVQSVASDRRLGWLAAVSVLALAVTLFGGQDIDRILFPTGVMLTIVATVVASRSAQLTIPWVFLVVSTVLLWHPFHTVDGSVETWLDFYGLRAVSVDVAGDRIPDDAGTLALPVLAAILYAVLARRPAGGDAHRHPPGSRGQRQPAASTPPGTGAAGS